MSGNRTELFIPTEEEVGLYGQREYEPQVDPLALLVAHTGARSGKAVTNAACEICEDRHVWHPGPISGRQS